MLLRNAGYNGLTIGVETGDDNVLAFMRKGYTSQDILTQCKSLEEAGIEYGFFYSAMGASNAFQLKGRLPNDKKHLLNTHPSIIPPNQLISHSDYINKIIFLP